MMGQWEGAIHRAWRGRVMINKIGSNFLVIIIWVALAGTLQSLGA